MSMGLFWPDCTDEKCPLTQGTKGYMVNGKRPDVWSMSGLLHREKLLCLALEPFIDKLNKNHDRLSDDSPVTITVTAGQLRFAMRARGEIPL